MIYIPAFANPFQGNVNRELNKGELIQALHLDIADELGAIYLYDAHVQAADIEIAKKVLADIRDEEKAHIDELMMLLRTLDPQEAELFVSGGAEIHKMLNELGIIVPEDKSGSGFSISATVDSLLGRP